MHRIERKPYETDPPLYRAGQHAADEEAPEQDVDHEDRDRRQYRTGHHYLLGHREQPGTFTQRLRRRSGYFIPQVMFGLGKADSIVTIEVNANGTVQRIAVAAPGFLVHYGRPLPPSTEVSWPDTAGRIVWKAEFLNS